MVDGGGSGMLFMMHVLLEKELLGEDVNILRSYAHSRVAVNSE
jgi:hypothetical protein